MYAVVLSLCASLCWGTGDLLAGLSSRRGSAWSVSLLCQIAGLSVGAAVLAVLGRPWVGWVALAPSLAAGVLLSLGMVAYFEALAVGTMSLVAPITSVGAVVPVIVGLARGEEPTPVQLAGVAIAFIGVVLASYERDHRVTVAGTIEVGVAGGGLQAEADVPGGGPGQPPTVRRDRLAAVLAVFAAACFGFVMLGFSETAKHDPFWPAIGARATSAIVLAVIVLAHGLRECRRPVSGDLTGGVGSPRRGTQEVRTAGSLGRFLRLPAAVIPATVAAGLLHLSAATLFSVASTQGLLSLVSVLSSLTAVVTVALAHLFLHERLDRLQSAGVVLAVVGVLAIAGG